MEKNNLFSLYDVHNGEYLISLLDRFYSNLRVINYNI